MMIDYICTMLTEGGHAIPGADGISQRDAIGISDEIIRLLSDAGMAARTAGSVGKKQDGQTSGDIDLLVQKTDSPDQAKEILACLEDAQGYDGYSGKAGGQIHWGWRYDGADGKRHVAQVDIELVPDLDMGQFFRHSPDFRKGESSWKGMFRTALLVQLAKTCPLDGKKYPCTVFGKDDGAGDDFIGTPKDFWTYSLMSRGLYIKHKSYAGKRQPRVAHPRTVEERLVTRDPDRIIRIILGKDATPEDAASLERLLAYVLSDRYPYRNGIVLSRIFYRMAYDDLVYHDNRHVDLMPERKKLFRYLTGRMEKAGLRYTMPDDLDDLRER